MSTRALIFASLGVVFGCGTITDDTHVETDVDAAPPVGFALSVEPTDLFLRAGESATVRVVLDRETGPASAVEVTVTGLPSGVTHRPLTIAPSASSATLVLESEPDAAQGPIMLSVEGDGGGSLSDAADVRVVVAGAPGSLDLSFAGAGTFAYAPAQGAAGRGIALQADGKILATGVTIPPNAEAIVYRLLPDGALDPDFGTAGVAQSNVGQYSMGLAVGQISDGRVVLAGVANGNAGPSDYDFALHAFTSGGVLDTGFDGDGISFYSPSAGYAELHCFAETSSGDLIASGTDFADSSTRILRFSSVGVRDGSFDINLASTNDRALLIQPDGKILLGATSGSNFIVRRYNANGTNDGSFGAGGLATVDFGGADAIYGMVLLGDGSIVAGGISDGKVAVARLLANGSPDSGFGTAGKVVTPLVMDSRTANGVAVDAHGRIYVVGRVQNEIPAVARLKPDGTPDWIFGEGGIAVVDFGFSSWTTQSGGRGIAIDADGRILIGADVGPGGGQKIGVARLWP